MAIILSQGHLYVGKIQQRATKHILSDFSKDYKCRLISLNLYFHSWWPMRLRIWLPSSNTYSHFQGLVMSLILSPSAPPLLDPPLNLNSNTLIPTATHHDTSSLIVFVVIGIVSPLWILVSRLTTSVLLGPTLELWYNDLWQLESIRHKEKCLTCRFSWSPTLVLLDPQKMFWPIVTDVSRRHRKT